jgi:hypothetical protein
MDLLLKEKGMTNQRVCMRVSTKGSKGTPFCTACSPLFFYQMKGDLAMVVQGEKQLMLKLMWDALKKLIRRILQRL